MKVHDKFDHYIDGDDEVYSVAKGSAKFDAVDRKVVAIFTEGDLPEVTEKNGHLRVAGKSGLFLNSSLFAGEPIETWILALLAIQHHRVERAVKQERERVEALRTGWTYYLTRLMDPEGLLAYLPDTRLIEALVAKNVPVPQTEGS